MIPDDSYDTIWYYMIPRILYDIYMIPRILYDSIWFLGYYMILYNS